MPVQLEVGSPFKKLPSDFHAAEGWGFSDSSAHCSAGFYAYHKDENATNRYMITAGHCLADNSIGDTVYDTNKHYGADALIFGSVIAAKDSGNGDYMVVKVEGKRYTRVDNRVITSPGNRQLISRRRSPSVGQSVCFSGKSIVGSQSCSTVVSVSTNPGGHTNFIQVNDVGAVAGDSGGPLYSGNTGYATLMGSSGSKFCFSPIQRVKDLGYRAKN